MVPKSAFLRGLLELGGEREAPPPITSVIVTTRDRIPQLQRCLCGFIENIEKHGRGVNYVVIDGSKSEPQRAKARDLLTSLLSGSAKINYAGMEEKVRFKSELVRAGSAEGLPGDIVDFCLFGDEGFKQSFGANRNAILLATVGELVMMTDDDTVYQPVALGEPGKTLELTSLNDPTILQYFGDRRELLAKVHSADIDILSNHEKLLGRSISGCMSSLGTDCMLEVGRIGPDSARVLRRTSAVVSATMSGIWGDSGMGSPNAALELMGESRDLAIRSQEDYSQAKNSREVLRGVPRNTVSEGSLFMAVNSGLDNRALLPPFLPSGRNEDGIFAMALHVCSENALIGYLPFAILHSPDEVRRFPQGAFLDPAPRIADIIAATIRSFTPSPGHRSLAEDLSTLGKFFVDLGAQEMDDFEDQIRSVWLADVSRYFGFLEYLLDLHHGQPDFWAKDVLSLIENFKKFIMHRSAAAPRELLETQSPDQAMETCRRVVRKFGELLRWWPVIYGAAGKLREAGIRLANPI